MTQRNFHIALGSNAPFGELPPNVVIGSAVAALEAAGMALTVRSRIWRTPAVPSGPDFANAVVSGRSAEGAEALLARLHAVEAEFARSRAVRWGARTLDLDLLALDDLVLPDAATQARWRRLDPERQGVEAPDRLILPHPRIADRAFVLVPWAEVAPGWRHPSTGRTVAEMLAALDGAQRAAVRPWR